MQLDQKNRETVAQYLTEYDVVTDALAKLGKGKRYDASISVGSNDDRDFISVGFDRNLAMRGLEAQKSFIEAKLRQFDIEIG